jgi:nucleotide-binding universal stress UspA family protein
MKRILVATDGSEGADRAVKYAAHWAKNVGAELLIVNVIGAHGLPEKVFLAFTRPQQVWLDELLTSLSAELLTKAQAHARAAGAGVIILESRSGDDAAQTIIDIAQEKSADAIVTGKRGESKFAAMLIGSVSQKLVSLAPLPVVVVP